MLHSRHWQRKRLKLKISSFQTWWTALSTHQEPSRWAGSSVRIFFRSEPEGDVDESVTECIRTILTREASYVKVVGESDVPAFMIFATALEQLGQIQRGEEKMLSLVHTLSKLNQRHSSIALADPYHDTEQVLLHQLGEDSDLEGEEFDGRSYMLHVLRSIGLPDVSGART